MKLEIDIEHQPDAIVYLKTDPEHLPRIVIGYELDRNLNVYYKLAQATVESTHYPCEIAKERSKKIGFKTTE